MDKEATDKAIEALEASDADDEEMGVSLENRERFQANVAKLKAHQRLATLETLGEQLTAACGDVSEKEAALNWATAKRDYIQAMIEALHMEIE